MIITIDTSLLTLGDLEDLEAGKVAALVRVLTKFSDSTREEVRALSLSDLKGVGQQLNAAIQEQQHDAVPFQTSDD